MKLLQLILVNIKRMLKDPVKVGMILLMPIMVLGFVRFLDKNDGSGLGGSVSNVTVAFNSEDEGELWQSVCYFSSAAQWIFAHDLPAALERLETNDVAVVYNIPADFTAKIFAYEKPILEAYSREQGNVVIPMEADINERIDNLIKMQLLLDQGIISDPEDLSILAVDINLSRDAKLVTGDMHSVTLLLISFIILGAVPMVTELMEFRKKQVLARAITTPSGGGLILGGLALSLLLFQVVSNVLVFFLASRLYQFPVVNFPLILICFILASLFSINLSLVVVRVIKSEGAAPMITAMISLTTLYLSLFAQGDTFLPVPDFVVNLGKFTPQYWIFESLEKSLVWPHLPIVALMVLALFSAGCYRLKDFVGK